MTSDDEFASLLSAAQAGGEWAVARLFREFQPGLIRYLRARAGDTADDVASEAWLAVARGLHAFEGGPDQFRAWLFTIARRRLIDERRRSGRRRAEHLDESRHDMSAVASTPEEQVLADMAGDDAARRIVALLPEDQADVILLRIVGGLTVEEVAQLVGKRAGTVRVLQHRGLRRLAERLGDGNV